MSAALGESNHDNFSSISFQSVREMNGSDELVYTMTIDGSDIVCVQKFKRI